ncbi:membrane protein [Corynebacterium glutamicum ZL-6]|uniref:hypothetical protein n=1 Tax=Corynebacterium TaxID=1716 RepID=UPI0008073985|nr:MULTISPECIES: hypothetical protein [Corynebacterium]ANR61203.1 membrane protein [[Brevibacterium] flavum ZL-1]ANR64203.1 membrane protein [Corynebacterium glutamicum ZL-6]PST77066.1 membrane protein [Corynebacterium glutamicum ZL-2]
MTRKFRRLHDLGYFIIPFVEFLSIATGYFLIKTAADEFGKLNFIGTILVVGGVVSLFTGWPLLFARVNDFRWDAVYLVGGAVFLAFLFLGPKEMTVLGLVAMFAGPGMLIAGFSYLSRRLIAYFVELRRLQPSD